MNKVKDDSCRIHDRNRQENAIKCEGDADCTKCGWNPLVHQQRVEQGFEAQKLTPAQAREIMDNIMDNMGKRGGGVRA